MARSRNIKPGFFKNEILGEADPIYSLMFAGLWLLADKDGRLEYRPKKIKAEIFPYRFDLDPCLALDWLKHESFITVYEIDQKTYIQITNWRRHQSPHHKEADSEIPPPPKGGSKEKKSSKISVDTQAKAKHDPTLSQDQAKENASCPTDSLNLIPDSLKNIPSKNFEGERGENPPDDPEPDKPPSSKFTFTPEQYQLAVWMSNPVMARHPSSKINLDAWADAIRKLIDIDGKTVDEITRLWRWIVNHQRSGFSWADNCRSPMKLRERKDGLTYFEIIRNQQAQELGHAENRHRASSAGSGRETLVDRVERKSAEWLAKRQGHHPDAGRVIDGEAVADDESGLRLQIR